MTSIIIKIFFVAFFLNLLYELLHSVLYTTCLSAPLKKYLHLIMKAALFDGISIAVIYYATSLVFDGYRQIIAFLILSLLFAYAWERYSLQAGKWEYSKEMPLLGGVGITPLVQLALTGILSVYIIFILFV